MDRAIAQVLPLARQVPGIEGAAVGTGTCVSVLALNLSSPTKARATDLLTYLWPRAEDLWVLTELGRGEGARLIFSPLAKSDQTVFWGNLVITAGTPDADWRYANVRFAKRPTLVNVDVV